MKKVEPVKKKRKTYPHVNIANRYARDVVKGKIEVGRGVKLACMRHFADLEKSKKAAFPYFFDKEKAERSCRFSELLVHVKGKWAGQYIVLEPWQCFVVCSLFGWLQKKDGLRRFREAYIEVPRKNGKSVLAACIALYMFLADGEAGAEIYAGATTEKQAWEVFRPAKLMAEKSPGFKETFAVDIFAKSMYYPRMAARFEPLIGNPGDGGSPHFAVADEYHEHPTSRLFDTMQTGMGARSQPLMLVITTAGINLSGPCRAQHVHVMNILYDKVENESTFGLIYGIDEDDDWTNFEVWKKANPNFGTSLNEDYLFRQYQAALQKPSRQNILRCRHLNQWLTADNSWLNAVKLEQCIDKTLIPETLKDKRCVIGLDLASKIDMAAVSLLFFDEENYWSFGKHYLPRETVDRPENQHYQGWEFEERLTVTEGATINFQTIKEDILELCAEYNVEAVAFDPWQATQISQELAAEGLIMIETRPTVANFSEAMKTLEGAIYSGHYKFDGDPVLHWMFTNVVCHYDKKDNVFPNKPDRASKIDGVVALLMAMNIAIRKQSEPEPGEEAGVHVW